MKKKKSEIKSILEKSFPEKFSLLKIKGEASQRDFYRVSFKDYSYVAMVYSFDALDEIENIVSLSDVYNKNRIRVPNIYKVLKNRIILFEDLGDISLQRYYAKSNSAAKKKILKDLADILLKVRSISPKNGRGILNRKRMKWELDFFFDNFILKIFPGFSDIDLIKDEFRVLVSEISIEFVFAHRDFHSRNIFFHNDELYLIDFQDSLVAPEYYDLVSVAFDSYMTLRTREYFFKLFSEIYGHVDFEQLYLTALQRNLKALGTFGFQIFSNKNLSYKKYIKRTLKHILGNPFINKFSQIKGIIKKIIDS